MARQRGEDSGGRIWSVFDEILRSPGRASGLVKPYPSVNVYERPDSFLARVEMPGVAREDLEVAVEGRTLVISGYEREQDTEGLACRHRERGTGSFRRSVSLPEGVNVEAEASASLKDGVLTIIFPKNGRSGGRKVDVSEG